MVAAPLQITRLRDDPITRSTRWCPASSELEPEAETDHSLGIVAVGGRDLAERARREAAVRVGIQRVVEDVAGFHPELRLPRAAHRELPEDREVQVVPAGAVELVAPRVAEAHAGRLRERARVEPLAAR